ncbi:hypothetical protein ABMB67_003867 [Halalkalibacter oceani]
MSKRSRSKRAIQQGKDAVQPANETEGKQSHQNERKGGPR